MTRSQSSFRVAVVGLLVVALGWGCGTPTVRPAQESQMDDQYEYRSSEVSIPLEYRPRQNTADDIDRGMPVPSGEP